MAHALGLAALLYTYFRDPASGGFLRCQWHAWTGLQCPGCGGQRALHALLHGDVAGAASHNAFALFVVGPLLAVCYAIWVASVFWAGSKPPWRPGPWTWGMLGGAALAFTLLRNWPSP